MSGDERNDADGLIGPYPSEFSEPSGVDWGVVAPLQGSFDDSSGDESEYEDSTSESDSDIAFESVQGAGRANRTSLLDAIACPTSMGVALAVD